MASATSSLRAQSSTASSVRAAAFICMLPSVSSATYSTAVSSDRDRRASSSLSTRSTSAGGAHTAYQQFLSLRTCSMLADHVT